VFVGWQANGLGLKAEIGYGGLWLLPNYFTGEKTKTGFLVAGGVTKKDVGGAWGGGGGRGWGRAYLVGGL